MKFNVIFMLLTLITGVVAFLNGINIKSIGYLGDLGSKIAYIIFGIATVLYVLMKKFK